MMRFNFLLSSLLMLLCHQGMVHGEVPGVSIKAEQWEIPRHGESLIKQQELGKIVRQWLKTPESIIEIRYPGGEEGELWVRELMDWLIALGIPSTAMHHVPGSGAEDIINIVIVEKNNE